MEIVIIEKKAFEALLSGVGTLTEKVNTLYRRCGDRKMNKWLRRGGSMPPAAYQPPDTANASG